MAYSKHHPSLQAEVDHTLNAVKPLLEENPFLHQYTEVFVRSMSSRTLNSYSLNDLAQMVTERYSFFKSCLEQGGGFRIINPKHSNKTVLEAVYPNMMHLLLTIEHLLRDFQVRITLKLHPVLAVEFDEQNQLKSIDVEYKDCPTYSNIFILFEEVEDDALLSLMNSRMAMHLKAISLANRDRQRTLEVLDSLAERMAPEQRELPESPQEWKQLLLWLKDNNFSFFGYTAYPLEMTNDTAFAPFSDRGLGVLSADYQTFDQQHLLDTLTTHVWKLRKEGRPFKIDTIRVKSPIQRFEPLMRLSLHLPDDHGNLVEHVFCGLLHRSTLMGKNQSIPVIREKMDYIFDKRQMTAGNYNYNEVIRIFTDTPKFELFRTNREDLLELVDNLFSINNPHEIHCFHRKNPLLNQLILLVVMHKNLFTVENIETITKIMQDRVPHNDFEVLPVDTDERCRLHFYFDMAEDSAWHPNLEQLEEHIGDQIKPWEDKIHDLLYQQHPSGLSEQLYNTYVPLMPQHYQARSNPQEAIRDIMFLEQLAHQNQLATTLERFIFPSSDLNNKCSVLFVYSREKLDLDAVMPILQKMGLYVLDQITARIGNNHHTLAYIQKFRVTDKALQPLNEARYRKLLGDLLVAVHTGRSENDALNALALLAELDWRSINVLMLYRNLFHQLGTSYSRSRTNHTLLNHPHLARLLFEYFQCKFSPEPHFGDKSYRLQQSLPHLRKRFLEGLDDVDDMGEDIILRRLFNLMDNTLRTNFYLHRDNHNTAISIKLNSAKVEQMPVPAPYREIYVHDVGMEGVHLRFGAVARGGLRWSDRPDDFRTEVLGLVKTQRTKNVVIVPDGSKGGFVVKKQFPTREELARESVNQYKVFIQSLLEITDNRDSSGQAMHPNHVMVYDELDPYLVVAADKGTATFSDIANGISAQNSFWLDDAFASGGSVGYDHKKEGITARGAWECVKLHFRELGKDIQSETTTVVGIGDMSGDVFGNGMLLSKYLKLLAAFNHLHIFLDPDPDPQTSWQERNRLFNTPRTTWKDYAPDLISTGGGVFDRKAKAIHLTPQVKRMLGVETGVMSGEELIQAILKMDVELFWLGGIGTYFKADQETHLNVGDPANNSVRIDISQARFKVVGEGANLGLTQKARIQFDLNGGHINTDAVDNSAGVNMSDYEVNLKILLQRLLQDGLIHSMQERNEALRAATDEVAELVLANNCGQHQLISMDTIRARRNFKVFRNLIPYLERTVHLNTRNEFIPDSAELDALESAELPLPRPVLAVLQAYSKMRVNQALLDEGLPDHPFLGRLYRSYYPASMLERFEEAIERHPLMREIIAMQITNLIINQAGSTFFYRMELTTGRGSAAIARVYLVFDECLRASQLRQSIEQTNNVSQESKYLALIELEDLLSHLSRNWLQGNPDALRFDMIEKYGPLFELLKSILIENESHLQEFIQPWQEKGFDIETATQLGLLRALLISPEVISLFEVHQLDLVSALTISQLVDEVFGFNWMARQVGQLSLKSDWEMALQDMLRQNLELYKTKLFNLLLENNANQPLKNLNAESLVDLLKPRFSAPLQLFFNDLSQLKCAYTLDLTALTVTVNRLNFLDLGGK